MAVPLSYNVTLDTVAELLCRDPGMSATELALCMGCSIPTAHARIRALQERGVKLRRVKVRAGGRGPKAIVYKVA